MSARRLVLSTTALELLRREALPPPLGLPAGFGLEPTGGAPDDALAELLRSGAAVGDAGSWAVHPQVAADLQVLAVPELAVLVRAARPGLEVTAAVAVSGPRGAGLLRTGDTAVRLSCFAAATLADELAGVVPAAERSRREDTAQEVPLDALAAASGTWLHGRTSGTLRATVLRGPRPDGAAAVVGSVHWAWDGAGWVGVQPLAPRDGRPWVLLSPVGPPDLGAWVAPLLAAAAA